MKIEYSTRHLRLSGEDGFQHTFHAFWLRESSDAPGYRDPITGHKLQNADEVPLNIAIARATAGAERLEIEFTDGHRAGYAWDRLRRAAEHPISDELEGEKLLWDASLGIPRWHELESLRADPQKLLALLSDLARVGFALVRHVPAVNQGSREFLDLIGYTRMTNNGDIEDIKALPRGQHYDLSMTPRALEPHVDNPYRIPQPGYTTLHCLRNDAEGGESVLIDGLFVAEKIRRERPDLFAALSTTPVVYRYCDDQAILENTAPFIDVAPDGRILHLRFHGRCDQVVAADPDVLDTFYAARRMYSGIISSAAAQLVFKLQPGELFMVDNYRLFHARRGFRLDTGIRHIQQAYVDRDVVSSRQKTLLRDPGARPWKAR